jgi:hypothetical protein
VGEFYKVRIINIRKYDYIGELLWKWIYLIKLQWLEYSLFLF